LILGSDSGRLAFVKDTTRSQDWLVPQVTDTHQTMAALCKNCGLFKTNSCSSTCSFSFRSIEIYMGKL